MDENAAVRELRRGRVASVIDSQRVSRDALPAELDPASLMLSAGLTGETRQRSEGYVPRTSVQVRTEYREAIERQLGCIAKTNDE